MKRMLACVAVVMAAVGMTSGMASAEPVGVQAAYHYGNMATGSCLDDSNYGVRGFGCNGTNFQLWTATAYTDGSVRMRSVATGKCLFDDGRTLTTLPCDWSRQQRWTVQKPDIDKYIFRSVATNECLDDSAWGLRTMPCTGDNRHQLWR